MEAERLASEAKKKKVEGLYFYLFYLFIFIYLVSHPNPCSLPPEWQERCRKIEEEKNKKKSEGRKRWMESQKEAEKEAEKEEERQVHKFTIKNVKRKREEEMDGKSKGSRK
jgi:hypothetical protein